MTADQAGPPADVDHAAEQRAAAVARAFDALVAAPDLASYESALGTVADLVAAGGQAHADDLASITEALGRPYWHRQFLRTFEVLDGQRKMGRFSDKDELYRIFVIDHRLAAFARRALAHAADGDGVAADIRRFHDEQLFGLSGATADGALLAPVAGLPPDPEVIDQTGLRGGIRRLARVDRVREAIDAWSLMLEQRDPAARAELDAVMTIARKEHRRALSLAAWALEQGQMTEEEHASFTAALEPYDKDNGGWPPGTSAATKAAITEAIAGLHELRAVLSR